MKQFCRIAAGGFALFALMVGCASKEKSVILARVGKAVLTIDDVKAAIPPDYRESFKGDQIINYVKEWVDAEILYQEALRRKIDREPEVARRCYAIERDVLCAELIHRATFDRDNSAISDSAVAAFYQAHARSLVRDRDVIKY
ncbi:MAG: hypothetical protein PHC61_18320, partial [Chitinivibrionales bacterium]|nr:hypothetical protein [Chitinivibrionales bacterium]